MNIGETIDGKYLIEDDIGQGGMGKVFRVKYGEEIFALKICLEKDLDSIKRFKREVRLMASIKHDNVIEVINHNLDYFTPYFVMPLCKFSIDTKLDKTQSNHKLALALMLDVCKGISAIHISGVIHRDIKPKNILLSHDNIIKISDLGLGKFSIRDSSVITESNDYMGTQGYIPPEFFKIGGTKNASAKSDIYQLGKTIYNVFTNSNPVLIERNKLPGGLLYIVQKCIADDPNDRYKTVVELEDALNNYLLSLEPLQNPTSAFENLINIAKKNLKDKSYDSENVEQIIQAVFAFKDVPSIFFDKFNEIPEEIIEIIASNFPNIINDLINIYIETTKRHFIENSISFSDADLVANGMKRIYKGTNDLVVKTKAMHMTLYAAVYCNRYHAMGVFDNMLEDVSNEQDAVAVVEMLKESREYYEHVADRIPKSNLHPLIQVLQQEIKSKKEEEAKRNATGFADW